MIDWTEKYRPKTLNDIVGNERALSQLRNWATTWNKGTPPKKKAVILSGKAGIGKTSSAYALAQQFNWNIIELNASDIRNATKIKKIVTSGAINETFSADGEFLSTAEGGRKLIILDEADNLYERIEKTTKTDKNFSDKGGKKAILDTLRVTKQPIILIVNDLYSLTKGTTGSAIKQLCQIIKYYPPYSRPVMNLLRDICRKENINVDTQLLKTIADRCKGDVRSAINDLQSLCYGKQHITLDDAGVLGYRDKEEIIFDTLREIFKSDDFNAVKESMSNLNETPDNLLLWLDENLPVEYRETADLSRGYQYLSRADIFLGRTFRRQQYHLWSYAYDLMGCGIASAKSHKYPKNRYRFPAWLREMSKTKSLREARNAVAKKIGGFCHMSSQKVVKNILPQFKHLFNHDDRFSIQMIQNLDLTENEILFLLESKSNKKAKQLLEKAEELEMPPTESKLEATTEQKSAADVEANEPTESEEEESEETKEKQPSLFDFQ